MWQTHLVLAPYKMRNRKAMKAFWFFSALILIAKCDKAYSDKNVSVEKVEEQSVTSELVNLLNGTYFNLNEKVCQLQRNVDAIEQAKDSDHQCECNEAEMNEFKQTVSDELHDFSKILSEFENQMRILQKEQLKLREMLDNDETASSTTTTTSTTTTPTTSTPQVCAQGWISSPENKCYYVSTTSEKTGWSTAISRCTEMGARLVEIQTDEEASFIMENLPSRVSRSDIIYTGRKRNDRDEWVFLSNDKPVDESVRTWADGDPDGGTQKCGCIRQSDDFLMLDCYCIGYDLFYICEIELAIASSKTTTTATTTTPTIPTPQVCAQGWISSPENNCYYVSTTSEKTEWSTAISRCTEMGARLVEIQTDEEASFIMENLPSRVSRSDIIYTGRKRNDRDDWVFLSNDKLVDTSVRTWADGDPDGGTQKCGCTRRSDDFLMLDCYCIGYDLFYICEIELAIASSTTTTTATTTTPTIPPPQVCAQGWISSPENNCYYVSTTSEKTEWSTAISRCTAMGARLVEIKTDEEASFIMENLPSRVSRSDIIYTGRKRNDRDDWVFLSNDKLVDTSVRTWADGDPDGGTQKCGCTRRSDDFLMLDCYCIGYDLFYICEIELAIASSTTTTTATTTTPTIPPPQVCAQGWISSPENNCYYVSTTSEKTEWSTAISRCAAMGARLVEIQTDEEAYFIMENLPSRVSRNDIIYTGRKRNNRDEWVFLSKEQFVDESVRTWGDGNPDGGDQRCGCTRRSDDFLMLDCVCTGFNLIYICEIEASSTTTTPKSLTTSTPQDCDEGWVSSPEKCYYVSTKSMKTNWNMAISRCTAMGAKLAEFQTDEEASVILPYLPHRVLPYDNIYTGRKRNDRDQWVFVSNDKPVDTSVRTWGDGEPDGGSQRCGCIRRANKFLMLDCFCTGFNLFYICEIER